MINRKNRFKRADYEEMLCQYCHDIVRVSNPTTSLPAKLRLTPCGKCNKQLCERCSEFIYVVDSVVCCVYCMVVNWTEEFPGLTIMFYVTNLTLKRMREDTIECPFCDWIVWFHSDSTHYNHNCERASFQSIEDGYKVVLYKEPRQVGDQKFQQELVMVSRVQQRLLRED
jgi:hypothetical protein